MAQGHELHGFNLIHTLFKCLNDYIENREDHNCFIFWIYFLVVVYMIHMLTIKMVKIIDKIKKKIS